MTGFSEQKQREISDAAKASLTRRFLLASSVSGAALTVGACVPTLQQARPKPLPIQPPVVEAPQVSAEVVGTGPIKVALLAAKTATGAAGQAGQSTINAAKMAMAEFRGPQISLMIYDTTGTATGAKLAADQAIADGASLILGPFFADEVRGAAPSARAANLSLISFSSDPSVAQPGVYITGFLVQDEVRQLINQAKAAGKRSIAAMLQSSAYGTLAEGALRQYASQAGIRVLQIVPYTSDVQSITSAAQAIAAIKDQIDCLFLPDGAGLANIAVPALAGRGVDFNRVQLIGSGQWNDATLYNNPTLAGAWFPAPDINEYGNWANRYRAMFSLEPIAKTTLVYDAVFLAAALAASPATNQYDPLVLANQSGAISRINGLFRLNLDGTNNRGLTIYQIQRGAAPKVISPAARDFTGV